MPLNQVKICGVLTSPNWPEDYSNDIHLIWRIAVPKGNIITIQMTHKELEYAEYADYVRITEGPGTGPTLKRYHGKSTGWRDQVLSTTEAVTVTFITDGSATAKGWRLEWGTMSRQEDIEEYMKRTYSDKLAYGEPHQLYRTPEAEFSRPQPSPGVILTGGWLGRKYVYSQDVRSTVKMFAESGNPNCSIPDLPTRRLLHTTSVFKNGTLVVCGGMYTKNTCISWNRASPDNVWEFAATLSIPRTRAVAFMDPVNNNMLLMGGDDADAMKTGVAIRVGCSHPVQRQFDLEHSANSACLIPLKSNLHEHSFVITGGIASDGYVQHYVDRYQSTGSFDRELPSLNTGRWNHACSSYLDKYNVDSSLLIRFCL